MRTMGRWGGGAVGGVLLLSSFADLPPVAAQKLGLSSSFGDVTVQNMKLGAAYPIRKLKGHGYTLTNISEVPVELVVDVVAPLQGSLRPLYENVPDTAWVKVTPRQFKLQPGASADSEVTLRVPEDGHWKDRNFQCALYAHTLQGSFVNVGIYDKILFSTGAGPEAMKAKGPRVDVLPAALRLGRIKAGKTVPSSSLPVRLRVRNTGDAPRKLTAVVSAFDAAAPAPKGWAAGDPGALKLDAAPLNVGSGETVDLPFSVQLPKEAAGKRLAFRVRVAPEEGGSESFGTIMVEAAGGAPAKAPGKAPARKAAPPVNRVK